MKQCHLSSLLEKQWYFIDSSSKNFSRHLLLRISSDIYNINFVYISVKHDYSVGACMHTSSGSCLDVVSIYMIDCCYDILVFIITDKARPLFIFCMFLNIADIRILLGIIHRLTISELVLCSVRFKP